MKLVTRKPVRTSARGQRRIVAVVSGSYGQIPAGETRRVSLRIRRAARYHVGRHTTTLTLIVVRNNVAPDWRPSLSRRVVVQNASAG